MPFTSKQRGSRVGQPARLPQSVPFPFSSLPTLSFSVNPLASCKMQHRAKRTDKGTDDGNRASEDIDVAVPCCQYHPRRSSTTCTMTIMQNDNGWEVGGRNFSQLAKMIDNHWHWHVRSVLKSSYRILDIIWHVNERHCYSNIW